MAKHNLTNAAKLTGKSRRTIQRYIKLGKLSSTNALDGKPFVNTAELIRVFGELSQEVPTQKSQHMSQPITATDFSDIISKAITEAQQPLLNQISLLTEKITNLTHRLDKPEHTVDEILVKKENANPQKTINKEDPTAEKLTTSYIYDIPSFGKKK